MKTQHISLLGLFAAVIISGMAGAEPLITAHRGGTFEYDDNALGGFKRCLKAGIRGFETDVQLTKDDGLVIMHDNNISRTTTGEGSVHDHTFAEMTALKLKKSGENVPSAKQVAELFRGRKDLRVEWEMKENTTVLGPERGPLYVDKLYALISSTMEKDTFVFTSFYQDTLKLMKDRHPEAHTGYITGVPMTTNLVNLAVWIKSEHAAPLLESADSGIADYIRSKGLGITVWMMQNYHDYAKAMAIGADVGTSDYPVTLMEKVKAKRRLVVLDLDGVVKEAGKQAPKENMAALKKLKSRYKLVPSEKLGAKKASKYEAIMDYAQGKGFSKEEIVFIGNDLKKDGANGSIRSGGIDYIEVTDYRDFPKMIKILLR